MRCVDERGRCSSTPWRSLGDRGPGQHGHRDRARSSAASPVAHRRAAAAAAGSRPGSRSPARQRDRSGRARRLGRRGLSLAAGEIVRVGADAAAHDLRRDPDARHRADQFRRACRPLPSRASRSPTTKSAPRSASPSPSCSWWSSPAARRRWRRRWRAKCRSTSTPSITLTGGNTDAAAFAADAHRPRLGCI